MIKFIEKTHRYIGLNNEELTSVSAFMERFKEKVDWKKIAANSAKKATKNGNPTTQKELLAKWERKRNISAEIGTLLHLIMENETIENEDIKTKSCPFDVEYKYSIPINDLEDNTVYPELMIYDLDHMICGQSDKVIIQNKTINIWDYKTDAEIKFKGYSSKWQDARKLLAPLGHLDDCNGNIYSIKMSMYMYMLWKANKGKFKPGKIVIEHVHLKRDPEDDNIPVLEDGKPVILKVEQIELPYRKKEVMAMLKTIK